MRLASSNRAATPAPAPWPQAQGVAIALELNEPFELSETAAMAAADIYNPQKRLGSAPRLSGGPNLHRLQPHKRERAGGSSRFRRPAMPRSNIAKRTRSNARFGAVGAPGRYGLQRFQGVTRSLGDMDSTLRYSPAAQPSAPFAASKTPELLREQSAPEESTADVSG